MLLGTTSLNGKTRLKAVWSIDRGLLGNRCRVHIARTLFAEVTPVKTIPFVFRYGKIGRTRLFLNVMS